LLSPSGGKIVGKRGKTHEEKGSNRVGEEVLASTGQISFQDHRSEERGELDRSVHPVRCRLESKEAKGSERTEEGIPIGKARGRRLILEAILSGPVGTKPFGRGSGGEKKIL